MANDDFVAVDIPGYVDWIFTTPLMLIELGILAGARPVQTITLIVTWLLRQPLNRSVQSESVQILVGARCDVVLL